MNSCTFEGRVWRPRAATSRDAARKQREQEAAGPVGRRGRDESPSLPQPNGRPPLTHCGDEEKLMKVSARNQLNGTVAEVQRGQTTAQVRINVVVRR
jgi:hypothetical protein